MKRKIMTLALCVLLIALSVGGSLAYFSEKSEIVHNVITTGSIQIELIEKAMKDGKAVPFENVEGVLPGMDVSKIVMVTNTGENDAFVRLSVTQDIKLAEGQEGEPDPSLVHIDFNTEYWTEKDGYWYFNGILTPGAVTAPLFTTVSFDKSAGNMYQGSVFTIDVSAQAVQVANNGDSALTAKGWPA